MVIEGFRPARLVQSFPIMSMFCNSISSRSGKRQWPIKLMPPAVAERSELVEQLTGVFHGLSGPFCLLMLARCAKEV